MEEQLKLEYEKEKTIYRIRLFKIIDQCNLPELRTIYDILVEEGFKEDELQNP